MADKKPKKPKKKLTVMIDPAVDRLLRHWCVDEGTTLSEGVERAVRGLMGAR